MTPNCTTWQTRKRWRQRAKDIMYKKLRRSW